MLDERKLKILEAIIDSYVKHAEPVGSRTLSKSYDLGVSSATIRNEMSDLEDLGLLNKPHTSAGRVPSDKAYRYYVDYMLNRRNVLTAGQRRKIKEILLPELYEPESFIKTSLKLLSDMTNYTMLVLSDEYEKYKNQMFKVISLNMRQVVLLALSDSGNSESFVITLDKPMEAYEADIIEELLNKYCTQSNQINSEEAWSEMIRDADDHLRGHLEEFKPYIFGILSKNQVYNLYYHGLTNLLNYPDYQDVEHVKDIMKMLVQEDEVAKVLQSEDADSEEVVTLIGSEINHEVMSDSSIILSSLMVQGYPIGRIALIGPVRMDYNHMINTLWSFSDLLNKL